MFRLLYILFFLPFSSFAQVNGVVSDGAGEPIIGARIIASNNFKVLSGVDGSFSIATVSADFPLTIVTSSIGYETDTLIVDQPQTIRIQLAEPLQRIETVVVTAGRRDQDIEDVAISMEIIRPELIDNKGITNLEDAVSQSPGVYAMDGQVSIRGGSGFAYGAGSRVMLLWNGMPLLSGDAADTKFNAVPMECASQVEILKGASSVLYGSGALNGIISLTEREPGIKGELRAKYQFGLYDNPNRTSLRWWSSNPTFHTADVYYGKMYKKFGFTISANGLTSDGYRQGETEDRVRVSGTLFWKPAKIKRLKTGIGYNIQYQETGNFVIWESDSLGYSPSGGADPTVPGSTLSAYKGIRANVDPYLKYIDRFDNRHTLKTRIYYVDNTNVYNSAQTSASTISYGDYQFQRRLDFGMTVTSGLTAIYTKVRSNLYGDHHSMNSAFYTQLEQNFFRKLDVTAGVRLEYFEQDNLRGDSDFYFGKDSTRLPVYPIFRAGLHYELFKATHLRASFGQGIRYPSVAERYTVTNVGALNIFPNPDLSPEKGWAAELGIKQVVRLGKTWKGLVDVAGFINEYSNMMEFVFGLYNPDTIVLSFNPNSPGYIGKWLGFRASNAERARISGIEFSFNSTGKIGEVELNSLIGYTYMHPISLNTDSAYVANLSTYNEVTLESGETISTYNNTLKYRFNHLVRGDVEATWKHISVGFSARYNSRMVNIDKIFEQSIAGTYILLGLKEYREEIDNKGALVFDARIGYLFSEHYRIGFIVNNLLNREYTTRPGDIQAPRNFMVQFQAKF